TPRVRTPTRTSCAISRWRSTISWAMRVRDRSTLSASMTLVLLGSAIALRAKKIPRVRGRNRYWLWLSVPSPPPPSRSRRTGLKARSRIRPDKNNRGAGRCQPRRLSGSRTIGADDRDRMGGGEGLAEEPGQDVAVGVPGDRQTRGVQDGGGDVHDRSLAEDGPAHHFGPVHEQETFGSAIVDPGQPLSSGQLGAQPPGD